MARKTTTTGISKPRGPRVTRPVPRAKRVLEKAATAPVSPAPVAVKKVAETAPPAIKAEAVSPPPAPKPVIKAPEPVAAAAPVEKAAPVAPAVAEKIAAVEPVAPQPSLKPQILKGTFTMATVTNSEKIQTMFTDISERAKTAFEKSTKLSEDFADLTKGNLEALAESAKIAAKSAETLAQEAADYSKKNFETATAALKRYSAVKSPAELLQLNGEFAKTSFDSAVAEVSKVSETITKIVGDVFQPLSTRYAVASEKIKSATAL